MRHPMLIALAAMLAAIPGASAPALAAPKYTRYLECGADAAAIQDTVDAFRTALGTLNPNTAGSVGSGRREINWDGVPDQFADPNDLPLDFFNVNSPRGAVFATPGSAVRVSADSDNPHRAALVHRDQQQG